MATLGFETPMREVSCEESHPGQSCTGHVHRELTGEGIVTCDEHNLRLTGPREDLRVPWLEHLVEHLGRDLKDLQERHALCPTGKG